jgi:aspartyl-tRNA(Asn)/glutamyl-tRNA(Gln) amidotransferase subunit A
MKPTYGLVSRYGVIAMASSTDVIGVLANSTQDVSSVMAVIAGRDEYDSTSIKADINFANNSTKQLKVALIKEYMEDGLDPLVRQQINKTVSLIKKSGITVEEISLPSLKYALAAYYIVVPAEISSNLARYDGVKFGHRAKAETLEVMYEVSRAEGFGYEAKRRIMIGSYVLSSGFYDAYYQKAQKVRTLIINDFNRAFADYDLLIGPVSPSPAFKIGEKSGDPLSLYLEDIMTVAISLAGLPAISVPTDTGDELPVGLQIVGKQQQDAEVIQFASMVEELQNG